MSVKVTLNCFIKENQFEMMKPFLVENLPNVRNFDGCMSVKVLLNQEASQMLLDEEWVSIEHHKQYIAFIASNGVLEQLGAFLEEAPVIEYFNELDM